jgi:hypothetical protein
MAVAHVKSVAALSAANATTVACNLGSAPTAGNLLVFLMAGDKNTGALTLAGFTQEFQLLSASVSLYYYWKVSDGTEQTINPSWPTVAVAGNDAWYGEYADAAVPGSTWQISGSASHITDELTSLAWSVGTTGTLSASGRAIAVDCTDSAGSVSTVAWSNSYTVRHSSTATGSQAGKYVSEAAVVGGATTTTTFTSTGTADQHSGAVAVFTKVSETPADTSTWPVPAGTFDPELRQEMWF